METTAHTSTPAPTVPDTLLLTLDEVARELRCARRNVERQIARRRLTVVHVGRSVRVEPGRRRSRRSRCRRLRHLRRHLVGVSASTTVTSAGNRSRNRALCCRCGEVRTVAVNYRGRRPPGTPGSQELAPWCTWLHCTHCDESTVHALVVDALADPWRYDGCDREQRDRRTDRHRRRVERRLRALAADGVTVIRAPSSDQMNLAEAMIEVIEYADIRGFVVRISITADPTRLLSALDIAEDLLDEPAQLGRWADDRDGLWRGLAIVDSSA